MINISNLYKSLASSATMAAMGFAMPGCVSVGEPPAAAHVTMDAVRQMQEHKTQEPKAPVQPSIPADSGRTSLEQLAAAPEGTIIR